jgi:hypothetical protein
MRRTRAPVSPRVAGLPAHESGPAGLKFRVGRSDCVIVLGALGEPSSSRFRGDIFVQRGREAVGHGHRNKEGPRCQAPPDARRVMSFRHLSCPGCRIRVRASAPEIGLLEGSCPICGAALRPVSSSSGVLGFRSFDLDALSEPESSGPPPTPGQPADPLARRGAASARDDVDAQRWSDEGGSVAREAAAEWPATR